jgi:cytochrome c biogenesis protein CcmG/thiol:disulfide interchange protein DsbE
MSADTTFNAALRTKAERRASRLRYLFPIALFAALVIMFAWALNRDPRTIPSALIDKPVPQFALQPVKGRTLGLSSDDLRGDVALVNVFASWCVACREEHPLLMQMKANGEVPVHGLNYKDSPNDAAGWLDRFGDPYTRTGADIDGRVAIDWAFTASRRLSSSRETVASPISILAH